MLLSPIYALASFDPRGNITPIYLKIDGIKLKVASSVLIDTSYRHKTFKCTVLDGDYQKQVSVVYKELENTWFLTDGKFIDA